MGIYTEHWKNYRRNSVRAVFHLFALILVGLPFSALVALGVQRITGTYPAYLHIGLLLVWLVLFTAAAVRYSRV